MNMVNEFDIDTPEGAEAYLKSQGIDVDKLVKDGLDFIESIKEAILAKNKNAIPLIDEKDPIFEILFRDDKKWAAHDYQLTRMMRELVLRFNNLAEQINCRNKD